MNTLLRVALALWTSARIGAGSVTRLRVVRPYHVEYMPVWWMVGP